MRMLLLLALLVSSSSWATDKHVPKNPLSPTPTIIYRSGDDHGMAGLLIGAGITAWLMHRRSRRAQPPPAVTVAPPVCEDRTAEIERRVQLACAK